MLSLVSILGCAETQEPQSVLIEFQVQTPGGVSKSYDKIISFDDLEDANNSGYHYYECRVESDGNEYRMSFWSHDYPQLPFQAIDIRYSFGKVYGTGLATPANEFSIHSSYGWMMAQIFRTQFLDSQKERYKNKNLYRDNLDCRHVR